MAGERLEGRNGQIWKAFILGRTQEAIAEDFGLSNQRVSQIIREVQASIPEPDLSIARQRMVEVMDHVTMRMTEIMEAPLPPAYSNGRPIMDENGQLVRDATPRMQAADRVVRINERVSKLLGLDAAAKVDVAVTEQAKQAAARAAADAVTFLHGGTSDDEGAQQ